MLPQNLELPGQAAKKAALDEQRNSILGTFLTPEAKERLQRVELVAPEKAARVENLIIQQAAAGRLQPLAVGEEQIKQLLAQVSAEAKGGEGVILGGSAQEMDGTGKVILSRAVSSTALEKPEDSDSDLSLL